MEVCRLTLWERPMRGLEVQFEHSDLENPMHHTQSKSASKLRSGPSNIDTIPELSTARPKLLTAMPELLTAITDDSHAYVIGPSRFGKSEDKIEPTPKALSIRSTIKPTQPARNCTWCHHTICF